MGSAPKVLWPRFFVHRAVASLLVSAYGFSLPLPLLGQQPVADAGAKEALDNAEADERSPDRENKELTKKTYDVRAYLKCPLGLLVEQDGRRVPTPDTRTDEWFLGPTTPLGILIQSLLVGYEWKPGVNHFAPTAGVLEITNTQEAHRDVERILSALAAMPALNPRGGGKGLDADRSVRICTTSLGDKTEMVESVLYDVSDVVQTMSDTQLETFIQGIDRQTWRDAGGPGYTQYYSAARALAVVQIPAVHEKIKDGLARARGLQRKRPPPAKNPIKKGTTQSE